MSPIDWIPNYGGTSPAPVAPAPVALPPLQVAGTVIRAEGPVLAPIRANPWKLMSLTGLAILLLPWLFGCLLAILAFAFVLRLLFHQHPRAGHGLFTEIFIFHVLGRFFQPTKTGPVYHYVLQTPRGQLGVRQEMELATGRIFVGNQLRLNGRWHRGEFIVRDGSNLTLGTELRSRGEGWRLLLPWIAGAILLQYGYLLSSN